MRLKQRIDLLRASSPAHAFFLTRPPVHACLSFGGISIPYRSRLIDDIASMMTTYYYYNSIILRIVRVLFSTAGGFAQRKVHAVFSRITVCLPPKQAKLFT